MRLDLITVLFSIFVIPFASIATAEVLILDCGEATNGRKIAYSINQSSVELIGQDEHSAVTVQRTLTAEGRIVSSYLLNDTNQVSSVVSISPDADNPSQYSVQRAITSTGEFSEFTCLRDFELEARLSDGITALLVDLEDFPKPLDVLVYGAMDQQGVEIDKQETIESNLSRIPRILTETELNSFYRSASSCWVVDNMADWSKVAVTVEFSLDRNGRVDGDIELTGYSGDDEALAGLAFSAARRAILRCQGSGYDLPSQSYDYWKTMSITFDPTTMRLQ